MLTPRILLVIAALVVAAPLLAQKPIDYGKRNQKLDTSKSWRPAQTRDAKSFQPQCKTPVPQQRKRRRQPQETPKKSPSLRDINRYQYREGRSKSGDIPTQQVGKRA